MTFISTKDLREMQQRNEKIAVVTSYDASFTRHIEAAGVEVILVGDSLGMVIQGHDSTLPVTVDDMVYHTKVVARAREKSLLIADMPYHSYTDKELAFSNAQRLIEEAGADMVKLEGGGKVIAIIEYLINKGIPVCGHLGLLPQSVIELGGYKVQGREEAAAVKMLQDAQALVAAGVELIVLECIPEALAQRIQSEVDVMTIGIGAGVNCSGQVLVLYDLLGITPGKRPKFTKDFLTTLPADESRKNAITAAIAAYVTAVKAGEFPAEEHSFH